MLQSRRLTNAAVMMLLVIAAGFNTIRAESAKTGRQSLPTKSAPSSYYDCGTYLGSEVDAMIDYRIQQARLNRNAAKGSAINTYVWGNLVVIEDDGTIVSEPFTNIFDLDNRTLRFTPNANGSYDIAFVDFAFDENFGTDLNAGDDTNHQISFASGFAFTYFGSNWESVWIRSNGNVTFGGIGNPDFYDSNDFFLPLPMIATLFADLNPAVGGRVLYRQDADKFVITWDSVPEFGTNNSNTIQLVLFADGTFEITYNGVDIGIPISGSAATVGINRGISLPIPLAVDYSADLPVTGSSADQIFEQFQNVSVRTVSPVLAARQFYSVQPDSFDQLVLTTDFSLQGASFAAFYRFVQNKVSGLRLGTFDASAAYGSAGRLQGFLHMNWVNFWPEVSANDAWLDVMGQEAEHEWGAFVWFNQGGPESDLLLGRGLSHWSFYLDTDGSVMEGNGWRDNGDGTFFSVRAFNNFSLLDHYLMGLRPAEEIPPFFFIDVPGATVAQRSAGPASGANATGTRHEVTIQDIINNEGPRVPAYGEAPKVIRQGYLYLTRSNQTPSQANLQKTDRFRAAWPDYFSDRTDGRGIFQTHLGTELPVAAVEGNVTNALDGSVVNDLNARWLEKNFDQPIYRGGHYDFRTLPENANASDITATIALSAFPFLPDTSSVVLSFGATVQHDRQLQPIPKSSLTGTVKDESGNGVQTSLTLTATSNLIDDFVITTETDANGNYSFGDIYSSSPPILTYSQLNLQAGFPFAPQTLTDVFVSSTGPTVLDVTLETAEVLLVNDDPNGAYSEFYTSALDEIGVTYFDWSQKDLGAAPVSFVPQFKRQIMIWFTGNATGSDILTPAEQDSIAAVLDAGGRVFLTGQDIAESLQGTDFLSNRLHVAFVSSAAANQVLLNGVSTNPVGSNIAQVLSFGAGGADNQVAEDIIATDGVSSAALEYLNSGGSVAGVTVADASNASRLVFFAIGFEALNAGPTPRPGFSRREDILQSIFNWFEGTTAVADRDNGDSKMPSQFKLNASYPNPLRTSAAAAYAMIHFELPPEPSADRVTLKVYDMLGRETRTLVDEAYAPGRHAVQWNGRDAGGQQAVSGVYFYKLEAGSFTQTRKLLLVR